MFGRAKVAQLETAGPAHMPDTGGYLMELFTDPQTRSGRIESLAIKLLLGNSERQKGGLPYTPESEQYPGDCNLYPRQRELKIAKPAIDSVIASPDTGEYVFMDRMIIQNLDIIRREMTPNHMEATPGFERLGYIIPTWGIQNSHVTELVIAFTLLEPCSKRLLRFMADTLPFTRRPDKTLSRDELIGWRDRTFRQKTHGQDHLMFLLTEIQQKIDSA